MDALDPPIEESHVDVAEVVLGELSREARPAGSLLPKYRRILLARIRAGAIQ
jgi:hypothetical protein